MIRFESTPSGILSALMPFELVFTEGVASTILVSAMGLEVVVLSLIFLWQAVKMRSVNDKNSMFFIELNFCFITHSSHRTHSLHT